MRGRLKKLSLRPGLRVCVCVLTFVRVGAVELHFPLCARGAGVLGTPSWLEPEVEDLFFALPSPLCAARRLSSAV